MKAPTLGYNKTQSFIDFYTTVGKLRFGIEGLAMFTELAETKYYITNTAGALVTDIIAERTSDTGVTIDGVKLKDKMITIDNSLGTATMKIHAHSLGVTQEYANEFKGEFLSTGGVGEAQTCDGGAFHYHMAASGSAIMRAIIGVAYLDSGKTFSGNDYTTKGWLVGGLFSANIAGILNGSGVVVAGLYGGIASCVGGTLTTAKYITSIWADSSRLVSLSSGQSSLFLATNQTGAQNIDYGLRVESANLITTGISLSGGYVTGLSITGTTSTTAIDILACGGRAIRIGTKGTSYENSTALLITSLGGVLDTDPAKNYMVGVFTKVSGNESTGATDDLGSAWFRTRTDTGVTTPAGYSLYGIKSQLRIYSSASAGATSISNWAATGLLGVLEVSGASTTFASGCIASAIYANVALGTGSVIASGAIVAALVAISASSVISTNTDASYYGLYVGKSGAVAFDAGIKIATASCTSGINFGTPTSEVFLCTDDGTICHDTDTHASGKCDIADFVGFIKVKVGSAVRYLWLSDTIPSNGDVVV
jgi:hypothetical protein